MIEEDIPTFLASDSAFSAIAGSRVYFRRVPRKPLYPAVIYHRISTELDRGVAGATGRTIARFQFDCRAESAITAKKLARALRDRLDDFIGTMGSTTVRNTAIDGESDDEFDSEAKTYRTLVDALITYED